MATLTCMVMAAMGATQTLVIMGMAVTEVEVADLILVAPGVLEVPGHPVTLAQQAQWNWGYKRQPWNAGASGNAGSAGNANLGTLVTQVHPETLGVLVPAGNTTNQEQRINVAQHSFVTVGSGGSVENL